MQRVIEPEWLDDLPPNEPRAIASRRDLRRLNRIMGHIGRMEQTVRELFPNQPPKRVIELGAGDGTFMLKLATLASWRDTEILLVDRQPSILRETVTALENTGCKVQLVQADIFTWLPDAPKADFVFANLFLHHFQPESLVRLFDLASGMTGAFAAGEPRRYLPAFIVSHFLGLIGCNDVTRHDAVISVRAGFDGQELSAFWRDKSWQLDERPAGVTSHWFVAKRR